MMTEMMCVDLVSEDKMLIAIQADDEQGLIYFTLDRTDTMRLRNMLNRVLSKCDWQWDHESEAD